MRECKHATVKNAVRQRTALRTRGKKGLPSYVRRIAFAVLNRCVITSFVKNCWCVWYRVICTLQPYS